MKLVVKVGGSLLKKGVPEAFAKDILHLATQNSIALVHGGADLVTEIATKLGKEQRFVVSPSGVRSRYTDRETAEIYHMVMSGLIAKRLVLALTKGGQKAISLSGADGSIFKATRKKKLVIVDDRGRKLAIDGGYTGRVHAVEAPLIDSLLACGYVPVVSPVAVDEEANALNIDGDRAASALASGIRADTVVFTTNVEGLMLDGRLRLRMTPEEASSELPKIGFGMQKKVMAAVEAVNSGVKEAVICSGGGEAPITRALAHESCTVISKP